MPSGIVISATIEAAAQHLTLAVPEKMAQLETAQANPQHQLQAPSLPVLISPRTVKVLADLLGLLLHCGC